MQINLINSIPKTNHSEYKVPKKNIAITKPNIGMQYPITFMGSTVVQKTISSQIAHEKDKLLKHIKGILSLNVPVLSEDEKICVLIRRAHAFVKMAMRKREEIEREMAFLTETKTLNPQQKYDRAVQLKKEYQKLSKPKLADDLKDKPPVKENYDYVLINKFKNAILNNDYDLAKIQEEHYKDLEKITTVKEFKEKYPSIRIPKDPKEVIIQKFMDTLNRNFYLSLDSLFEKREQVSITQGLIEYFDGYFDKISNQFKNKTKTELIELLGLDFVQRILDQYVELKEIDNFEQIPINRISSTPTITTADQEMLDIDFDAFVISTLKKMYLEGKKLNQIEYIEGNKKVEISSIKSADYKFEKIPEKIKRLIQDAQKPARLQRDYQNFTTEELKSRLNYYVSREIGYEENIFDTIVAFDSCKFTSEDKQYLIKFLQILDNIIDEKISKEDGYRIISESNIRPLGTLKLNEIERKSLEENLKLEQQRNNKLYNLQKEFNNTINKFYELNLPQIAETFAKYYPENLEDTTVQSTQKALQILKSSLELKEPNKIRTQVLRWEIYNDYIIDSKDTPEFVNAEKYATQFNEKEKTFKIGQYLINREIINNYPANRNMTSMPKILDKIMEKFGHDKDLATMYMCKYEDYLYLDKEERKSILNILKIFDAKNSNDRILLKNIIEKDYVNSDTHLKLIGNSENIEPVFVAKAKKEILNKYMFPICMDFFEAFENALTTIATEHGSSGIKKVGSNNNALGYKIEVKIKGYTDRLFSSNNDYKFDIYSEKGLHK